MNSVLYVWWNESDSKTKRNEADTVAQTRTRAKTQAEHRFLCSELGGGTILYSSFCLVYYYMLYIVGDVTDMDAITP